jgi:hypothetical protein
MLLGSFTEEALGRYEELVQHQFAEKQKRVRSTQGTEMMDNYGVSDTDHDFLDKGESQNADDYAESYDFTVCVRANGTLYGIADGKRCRKGSETKKQDQKQTTREKKSEGIRKRGERSLKRATAEKVLEELQQEGKRANKADERRAKKDGFARSRPEAIQVLVGKGQRMVDRLVERRRRVKDGSVLGQKLDARIQRLQKVMGRLQEEKLRLNQRNQ